MKMSPEKGEIFHKFAVYDNALEAHAWINKPFG